MRREYPEQRRRRVAREADRESVDGEGCGFGVRAPGDVMSPLEILRLEIQRRGVRGVAREASVTPSRVSRIARGLEPMPKTGMLAEWVRKAEPERSEKEREAR